MLIYQQRPEATPRKPLKKCWCNNTINFKLHHHKPGATHQESQWKIVDVSTKSFLVKLKADFLLIHQHLLMVFLVWYDSFWYINTGVTLSGFCWYINIFHGLSWCCVNNNLPLIPLHTEYSQSQFIIGFLIPIGLVQIKFGLKMTLILIFLYNEAFRLGSSPSNIYLQRCARKLNMSQSQYLIGFLISSTIVWIQVL